MSNGRSITLDHIPVRRLADYACNRIVDRHECQQIMTHVNECPQCRQALAIAWRVAHAATRSIPEAPTAALVDRVLKAAKRKQHQQHRSQPLPQLPATLLHDSQVAAAAAGIRGGAKAREWLFTFGHFDLHLAVSHDDHDEQYTLLGQLLAGEAIMADLESNQIALLAEQQPVRTVLTDDLGRFRLSNLRSGQYDLQITTESCTTLLQALTIDT